MTNDPNVRGPHNTPCQHCGALHGFLCPWVKAYEYHSDGSLKRVEFREAPGCDGPAWTRPSATVTQEQIDRTRRSTDWRENSERFRWNPETHTYDFVGDTSPGGFTWLGGD
jgi:hypothetical protein